MFNELKLKDFKNKHDGQTCLVCGLGMSLQTIGKKQRKQYITIGVNDINVLFTPTYQIISEPIKANRHPQDSDLQRKEIQILNTDCPFVFSRKEIELKKTKPIFYEATRLDYKNYRNYPPKRPELEIGYILSQDRLPAFRKITTIAISLAIYMGFKRIGVIGFDLQGDRVVNNSTNRLHMKSEDDVYMNHYIALYTEYCQKNNIELYNLSQQSIIKTMPNVKPEEFFK